MWFPVHDVAFFLQVSHRSQSLCNPCVLLQVAESPHDR